MAEAGPERFSASTAWATLVGQIWGGGERPEWHQYAACREKPELWWSSSGRDWAKRTERARAVCERCPVLAECLRDVIGWETRTKTRADHAAGVVGGMTGEERKALYQRLTAAIGQRGSAGRRLPRRR